MRFTDIFIERPVLATVVSLLILVMGLGSVAKLSVRQYPKMTNTTIIITTAYSGASPDLVQGFITTPLLEAISSADGIDYLTASSTEGMSTITAYIKLNYDANAAMTDITGKVTSVRYLLPRETDAPSITKQTGDNFPAIILSFTSDKLNEREITAYLQNVIQPKLNALGGISKIQIWGEQPYAMRIWLDPTRMALMNVTPEEVNKALTANNMLSTPGQLKGSLDAINLSTNTDLHSAEDFNELIVRNDNGRLIRIKDVGHAVLGSKSYSGAVNFNGKLGVFGSIITAPGANPLTVVNNIVAYLPTLERQFPNSLKVDIVYNSTIYIRESIKEVIHTILEAALIVVIVIFSFLGAPRSVLIPMLTIPLSLIGVFFLMMAMGFSINLLTLLAMVLAIGLVVDDAIVVVENIYRHLEEGMEPVAAAKYGAQQITGPVIVMTLTLAAVFAPIGFMGGLTGSLFTEFAFTLAASVVLSGVIALTLSPMLCAKLINREVMETKLVKKIDRFFDAFKSKYHQILHSVLEHRLNVLIVILFVFACCYLFVKMIPKELAPQEDQGFIGVSAQGPATANLDYLQQYDKQISEMFKSIPGEKAFFIAYGAMSKNSLFSGIMLKPWSERKTSQMKLKPMVQKQLYKIAGLQANAFEQNSLPGTAFGLPVQFVLISTQDQRALFPITQELIKKAYESHLFLFVTTDLRFDNPELVIDIDRIKAGDMGIDMRDVANALSTLIGGNYINLFSKDGYSYQVIPQATRSFRNTEKNIENIHIRTKNDRFVPLSTVVHFKYKTQPQSLNQFQQLNSAIIQALPMPGVTLGKALDFLAKTSDSLLPNDVSYDYSAASRQLIQQGNSLGYAFLFALIIIFLLLSAQFESFRDPLIIMFSVPMSIFGAMLPLFLGFGSMNIYTQIGLVTLIGLITKHGILIVDFANHLQREQGLSIRAAIEQAAAIRLRPILMTTAAMVFGVFPMILATGPGAVSRFQIGLVIAAGMTIGTFFTLFVVPTIYTYLAQDHRYLK